MSAQIQNPVLRGFSPDPSIVRVGADYYIATSTFEWFPGVRLHHSRDLVHWREIGCAVTRPGQLDLRGVPDSGGVWAPSLSHADGLFWLVYTTVRTCGAGRPFKDLGVYLITAPAIEGPWSDPVALSTVGFDPSLFHDDDGRKWVVNMVWDHRKAGLRRFAGIVAQEYDPRARRMVGPETRILERDALIEGPNLYKRDGWYHLMLAEGGTGWTHGIAMARSRHLLGPYEADPQTALLTTRDAPGHPLQKAGHGELVQTPEGEWYLVHLASRPVETETVGVIRRYCVLGRETCLQRVRWNDEGWLRLEGSGDGAAPWHPAVELPAPAQVQEQPWPTPAARDDFDAARLDHTWWSLREPIASDWASLAERPGWLRLRGRESLHSVFSQSLLAKPLRHLRCVVETCVDFRPGRFTQMAGLVCYYDTRTHYYLRLTHDEQRGTVLGLVTTDDGAYREPAQSGNAAAGDRAEEISVAGWPRCHLRATLDVTKLQFAASADGRTWFEIGPVLALTKLSDDYGTTLHFTGAMVGLCAQDLSGGGSVADFDYFSITPTE